MYGDGQEAADGVRRLADETAELCGRTSRFSQDTRAARATADVAQQLSALELAAEGLAAAMQEKEREFKRARTARSEYGDDADAVQAWVRAAELTARDRALPPAAYRERLVAARSEAPAVEDRLARLSRNARTLLDGSRDADERGRVQAAVLALTEQFAAVCGELETRQAAVEDACEAVARFLALLEKVLIWVETQRAFLARPLPLADLQEAQQKQTEYGVRIQRHLTSTFRTFVLLFNMFDYFLERVEELQAASEEFGRHGQGDRSDRARHELRRFTFQVGVRGERDGRCGEETS